MKIIPKAMAKKPTKDFMHKGMHFRVVFSHPKSRASSGKPCRALITPRIAGVKISVVCRP